MASASIVKEGEGRGRVSARFLPRFSQLAYLCLAAALFTLTFALWATQAA